MPWYEFTPIDSFPHDATQANNYTLSGVNPPTCPNPNLHICAIQASNNAGKPIITTSLIGEMLNAVNNNFETTNVLLRPNLS